MTTLREIWLAYYEAVGLSEKAYLDAAECPPHLCSLLRATFASDAPSDAKEEPPDIACPGC